MCGCARESVPAANVILRVPYVIPRRRFVLKYVHRIVIPFCILQLFSELSYSPVDQ